jgi:hypothetical protein
MDPYIREEMMVYFPMDFPLYKYTHRSGQMVPEGVELEAQATGC